MRLRDDEDEDVTFLELFFDLVFVFAITQLSGYLIDDISVTGAAETLLLFLVVWWAWIYTVWMTNWFDPDTIVVRLVLLTGMLASMLMAVAIPSAFGDRALLFAGGYVGLQLVRNLLVVLATDDSEPLHPSFVRLFVWNLWVGVIWIAGALADDSARAEIWICALVLDYAGPLSGFWAPGLGRTKASEWEIHEVAERSSSTLAADAERQGRLARDAYTYLHIPIVAGVIIAAVANDLVIERPTGELAGAQLAVLAAGPILYLLGQNLFRLRMTRTLWRLRMAAIALIAGVCFVGTGLPAVVTWSAVLAILVPVVVVETRARVKGATLIS